MSDMIITTVRTLFKRLPFRWYEGLVIVTMVIGAGMLWFQSQHIDVLTQQVIVAEEAIDTAVQLEKRQQLQQQIDQTVVMDWMQAREVYRNRQRITIDTTFLDYFTLPDKEPPDVPNHNVPSISPTPTPVAASVTDLSDHQLNTLADGMWDIYCQTGVDDPKCLP
jgi:hypothetical protein